MFAGIVFVLLVLITAGGFFYWRRARRIFYANGCVKDVDPYSWSGSPWEGRPKRGGMFGGFSFVAMTGVLLFVFYLLLSFKVPMPSKYFPNGLAAIDLFLYLTWVCFRQNRQALKMAEHLSKDFSDRKALYMKAFKYWPTRVSRWIAPWLGVFYYFKFKRVINSL